MTGPRVSKNSREELEGDAYAQAAALLAAARPAGLPSTVVFDLDYTLWPCWCEMYTVHCEPPGLYPDVRGILKACRDAGLKVAVASRTPTPHVARAFLEKLGLATAWDSLQLIPAANGWDSHSAQKDTAHLPAIRRELGGEWGDMLFFDDEHGNVVKVSRLGVPSVLVDGSTGLTIARFREGLDLFASEQRRRRQPGGRQG